MPKVNLMLQQRQEKFRLNLRSSKYQNKLRSGNRNLKNDFFANLELKKIRKKDESRHIKKTSVNRKSKHEPLAQGKITQNCDLVIPSFSSSLPIVSSRTSEKKNNKPSKIIITVKKRLSVSENQDKYENKQSNFVNLKFYRYIHLRFIIPNFLHVDQQQTCIFKKYKSIVQMKIVRIYPSPLNPGTLLNRKYDIITAFKEMSPNCSKQDLNLRIRERVGRSNGSLQDYIQSFTQKAFQMKTIQEYMELYVYQIRPKYFDAPSKLSRSVRIRQNIPPCIANNEQAYSVPRRDKVLHNENNPQILALKSLNSGNIVGQINQPAGNTSRSIVRPVIQKKLLLKIHRIDMPPNVSPYTIVNQSTTHQILRVIQTHTSSKNVTSSSSYLTSIMMPASNIKAIVLPKGAKTLKTPASNMEAVVLPKGAKILKTPASNMEEVVLPKGATTLNTDSKRVIYVQKNKENALTESNIPKTVTKFIPLTPKFLKTSQWKQISNQDLNDSPTSLLLNISNTNVLSPGSRKVSPRNQSYIHKRKTPICRLRMQGNKNRTLQKIAPKKKLKFPGTRLNHHNPVDEMLHLKNELVSCYGLDDQEVSIDELLAIPESEFLPTNVTMANLFL